MDHDVDFPVVRTWRTPAVLTRAKTPADMPDDGEPGDMMPGDMPAPGDMPDDGTGGHKPDPKMMTGRATVGDPLATMEVRFSKFGTWYNIDSWFEGTFLERVQRGAFAKTIAESGPTVRVLFNHGFDPQIGDKLLGRTTTLTEQDDSPVGVVPLYDTTYNRDLLPGLADGGYGSSFTFRVIKDEWNNEPAPSPYNPQALPERTITEVKLMEFGPVTWPANPDATASLRCLSTTDEYYEHLRRRDPTRVDALRSRIAARRTPDRPPAADGTGPAGAADREPTTEPVRHSGALPPAVRLQRIRQARLTGLRT